MSRLTLWSGMTATRVCFNRLAARHDLTQSGMGSALLSEWGKDRPRFKNCFQDLKRRPMVKDLRDAKPCSRCAAAEAYQLGHVGPFPEPARLSCEVASRV